MSSQQTSLNADGTFSISDHPEVDGAEKLAQEPTDEEIRWGITSDELIRRKRESAEPSQSCERRCHECGNRVTMTPSGFEAGHEGRKEPCSQWVDASEYVDLDKISELDEF